LLELATEAEPQLWKRVSWHERLESEHDNLRAALDWCAANSPETGLHLAGALHWFWQIRGHYTEARRRLDVALAGSPSAPASLRAKALCAMGQIVADLGDSDQAKAWGEKSLALCREAEDTVGTAWSLLALAGGLLAPAVRQRGPEAEQALALFRESGDTAGTAMALYMSGTASRSDEAAVVLYEESLALCRLAGYRWLSSYALEVLGWRAAFSEGSLERAKARFEESLAIRREFGDTAAIMHTLHGLLYVAEESGDEAGAAALVEESLALARDSGNPSIALEILDGAGIHHFALGEYERAAKYYEEALALCDGPRRKAGNLCLKLAQVARAQRDHEKERAFLESARVHSEENLANDRKAGKSDSITWSLINLASVTCSLGNYGAARAGYEEALAICQEQGDKRGIANCLEGLGAIDLKQGKHKSAWARLMEGLVIRRELDPTLNAAGHLEGLATIAAAQGRAAQAARLFGAAARAWEGMSRVSRSLERPDSGCAVASVRAALGEEAFAAAWASGRVLTLEEALAEARWEPKGGVNQPS
jgi:tetratricopeptide (TPR) repeat protein